MGFSYYLPTNNHKQAKQASKQANCEKVGSDRKTPPELITMVKLAWELEP